MIIKQILLDLGYGKDIVDSILSGEEDRDSNGNGVDVVDDEDRGDASTSDDGDTEDDTSC